MNLSRLFSRTVGVALLGVAFVGLLSPASAAPPALPVVQTSLATFEAGARAPYHGALYLHTDGYFYGSAYQGGHFNCGAIFKINPADSVRIDVVEFTGVAGANPGSQPRGELISDSQGILWGTTYSGGDFDSGTVFKLNPASGKLTTVYHFPADSGSPRAGLAVDDDGFLWGVATGLKDSVFKVDPATGTVTTVLELADNLGSDVEGELINVGGGHLWGATRYGGASDRGTVFKIATGNGFASLVHPFTYAEDVGGGEKRLANDGAGNVWVTSAKGGAYSSGAIVKINIGSEASLFISSFEAGLGKARTPYGRLVSDGAGNMWGTNYEGGTNESGAIFSIANNSAITIRGYFGAALTDSGDRPYAGLARDGQGNLWGTTYGGGAQQAGSVFRWNAATQALQTMVSFTGDTGNFKGAYSRGGLVADSAGYLWGTTASGGTKGCGTVFKYKPTTKQVTKVIDFTGTAGPNLGRAPTAGLTADAAGNLWGTTSAGGTGVATYGGYGTVFKINPTTGVLTTVVNFRSNGVQGDSPRAPLIYRDGMMWGTTQYGASGATLFRINPATAALTTVTSIDSVLLGAGPLALDLFRGVAWATGLNGGIYKVKITTGEVQSIPVSNPNSWSGSIDGGLTMDASGEYLWGACQQLSDNPAGSLFRVNASSGVVTHVLYFSTNGPTNRGANPYGRLWMDGGGSFWGTTSRGGEYDQGTVFQFSPASGRLTTVAEFSSRERGGAGNYPNTGALLNYSDGYLYGITSAGGLTAAGAPAGGGQIYRIARDLTTETPTLTTPAIYLKNPIEVSFSLPEAALDGSVKLTFIDYGTKAVVSTLILAGSEETQGSHSLSFDPANPVGEKIVSGAPIPDGAYSLELSYQDAWGNAPKKDSKSYLRLDTVKPVVSGKWSSQVLWVGPQKPATMEVVVSDPPFHHFAPPVLTAGGKVGVTTAVPGNPFAWNVAVEIDSQAEEGPLPFSLTVTDDAGNVSLPVTETSDESVAMVDRTPPTVSLPQRLTVDATSAQGALMNLSFPVSDELDPAPIVITDPAVGGPLPFATSTVFVTAVDAAGNTTSGSVSVTVRDLSAPVVTLIARTLPAGSTGTAAAPDFTAAATDAVGVKTVEQTPPAGTLLPIGTHLFSVTASDAAGHSTTAHTVVTVFFQRPDATETGGEKHLMAHTGTSAPGAGDSNGPPAGTVLSTFGPPAIDDLRTLASRVTMKSGRTLLAGIYLEDGAGEGRLPAFQNGPALDANGAEVDGVVFKSFLDPVTAPGGAVAFAATLKGPKTTADQGVWSDLFSPTRGEMRQILREGSEIPGLDGARLKSVTSLSLRDGELLALVTLSPAKGLVTAADDTALVFLDAADKGTVLLREGKPLGDLDSTRIKSFSVLSPALGSPGHGRWHADGVVVAKVLLTDGQTVLVRIGPDHAVTPLLSTTDAATAVHADAKWKSFALPAVASTGAGFATIATLKTGLGGVSAKDDSALLFSADGSGWAVIARENGEAPADLDGSVARYLSFFDPIVNDAGQMAFLATTQGKGGKKKTDLLCGETGHFFSVAGTGDNAPDENGAETEARWSKFISYALPSGAGAGVIFLAETSGGGTTAKNKLALYGVGSDGKLRRLLRTGTSLEEKGPTLTGVTLLNATKGAFGTTRSFNATGSIALQATLSDKTQTLIRIDLP